MLGWMDRKGPRDIVLRARQESKRRTTYPRLSKLYLIVVIIGMLDFVLFLAGAFYLGGDAVNGKVENAKYYVWGYRFHDGVKGFTEVSQGVFDYSKWHVYSVWATFSVMVIGTALYKRLPTDN